MRQSLLLVAACAAIAIGCGRLPETFAPPAQREPLTVPPPSPFGAFVAMSDPQSSAYVVRGFASASEGAWRWAYDHPALRFWLADMPRVRFEMDLAIPPVVYRSTGPVTLTLNLNGKFFDRVRYEGGQHNYSKEVPPELVKTNAINIIEIEPDKSYVTEGIKHAFVLVRAGFVE